MNGMLHHYITSTEIDQDSGQRLLLESSITGCITQNVEFIFVYYQV